MSGSRSVHVVELVLAPELLIIRSHSLVPLSWSQHVGSVELVDFDCDKENLHLVILIWIGLFSSEREPQAQTSLMCFDAHAASHAQDEVAVAAVAVSDISSQVAVSGISSKDRRQWAAAALSAFFASWLWLIRKRSGLIIRVGIISGPAPARALLHGWVCRNKWLKSANDISIERVQTPTLASWQHMFVLTAPFKERT